MPGVKGRSGGRNAKPAEAHQLAGTHRPDRHGPAVPLLTAGQAPRWQPGSEDLEALGDVAARLLTALAADYALDLRSGVLALQAAQCLDRIDGLQTLVTEEGALVDGEPHRLIKALQAEQRGYLALLRTLNLEG